MKVLFLLIKKDLLRDIKRPWGVILILILPVLMAGLMSLAFGGGNADKIQKQIRIHVALLDQDDDMISNMLRSASSQGNANQNLQIHPVKTIEEGIKMLEDRKASAFVALPKNLTANLLDGVTSTIQVFRNPAEGTFPTIVEQGVGLGTVFISEGIEFIGPEIKEIRNWIENKTPFENWGVAMVFFNALEKMDRIRPFINPPLITFNTIPAKEYIAPASQTLQNKGVGN